MSRENEILSEALEAISGGDDGSSFAFDERKSKGDTSLSSVVRGVGKAVKAAELELERKRSRIDPEPTSAKRRQRELLVRLQDAAIAIEDGGDSFDVEAVKSDLERLCKEAGVKDVKSFRNNAEYERLVKACKEAEETAAKEVSLAKKRLEEMEFTDIEDTIARIEDRGRQLDEMRGSAIEALKALYGEICDRVDNTERGAKRGGVTDYGKLQKAPLIGENSKAYQARMRKLGRASEVPETIKGLDEVIEVAERRWQRVASLSPEDFATVKANWRKTVFNLMNRASIATNMYFSDLNDLFEGHLSSRNELPLSKRGKKKGPSIFKVIGNTGRSALDRFTANTFGTKKTLSDEEHEKYGVLHTRFPSESDKAIGAQFGRNVVRWKPESVVATMFCGDSICHGISGWDYQACPLVSDPSPVSFDPGSLNTIEELRKGPLNLGLISLCRQLRVPYIELQLHGNEAPTVDDIESVSFLLEEDFQMLSNEAVETIKELGIEVYLGGERMEISDNGELVEVGEANVEEEEKEVSDLTEEPLE